MYPDAENTDRAASSPTPGPARVLVVGAGALGCAAARTLAQDGSVRLSLVDDDRVERSNLQRQVLYTDDDLGRLKVEAAAARLADDFGAQVRTAAVRLDARTGPDLINDADIVIDATDDPPSKFLIGRLCVASGVPYVYGGVARTGGQWLLVVPGASACLECVFPSSMAPRAPRAPMAPRAPGDPEAPEAPEGSGGGGGETAAGCSALGILAPVAGVVGCMQALTALAFLGRPGRSRPGRLHLYELTGVRSRHVDFAPDAGCFCSAAHRHPETRRASS